MKFIELETAQKEAFAQELSDCADKIGGANFLLHLIEDVKKQKDSPLLSKEKHYSFSKGFVRWEKAIYPDTLDALFTAILRIEREGDIMAKLKEREQKKVANMLKTLSPIRLEVKPKNSKDGEGFSLPIIQRIEEGSSDISLLFKTLFFYNTDFAKQALAFAKTQQKSDDTPSV